MMEDTLDSVFDDEELEYEAQDEVDKVLFELTEGLIGATVGANTPEVTTAVLLSIRLYQFTFTVNNSRKPWQNRMQRMI